MMVHLTRGERFKDARTVHNLHGKQTMDEVGKATGIMKSLIKDLEDDEVQRDVGYTKILSLANHYGVSIDWLLGRVDDPSMKPCATDDLRLTTKSVKKLKDFSNSSWANHGLTDSLNDIIESDKFLFLLMEFWEYKAEVKKLIDCKKYLVEKVEGYGETIDEDVMTFAAKAAIFKESCVHHQANRVLKQSEAVEFALYKFTKVVSELANKYRTEVESNG